MSPPPTTVDLSSDSDAPEVTEDIRELLRRHGAVDTGSGVVRLLDHRLVLLRPETIVDLQKQLERTVGLSSKGFLYLAGETASTEGHWLIERLVAPPPDDGSELNALERIVDLLASLGWGRFEIALADREAQRYVFHLDNSPVAESYGPSTRPVCHILAGWLAGIARTVLHQNLFCEEVVCRAQGKPRCEFQLRPRPHP